MRKLSPSVWAAALGVVIVVGLAGWAVATIHLQTELLPLFPAKFASVKGVRLSMSVVSSGQQVTIVLTPPAVTAEKVGQLESELQRLPEVQAVNVAGQPRIEPTVKMVAWSVANLPPAKFSEFQSLFTDDQITARLQGARDQLAGVLNPVDLALLQIDPLQVLPWLQEHAHQSLPLPDLSAGGDPSIVVMHVQARRPLRTFHECQEFVRRVRQVVAGVAKEGTYITGEPAFIAENSSQVKYDIILMVLLATGLTWLLLWLFYRSVSALVWMTVVLSLALLTGVIAARVLFDELNVVSIGFASILIGLGSDYCILVYHFHAFPDDDDREKAWRRVRRWIWLSATTTALSFGVLYFSSFPGLQQMVVLIGTGLFATAFFATTLLPEILQRARSVAPAWLTTVSDGFAAWQERHRHKIVLVVVASLLLAVCLWPVLRGYKFYDPDFNRLVPGRSEAYRGLEVLQELTKSRETFDVVVSSQSWDELRAKAARVTENAMLLPQADFLAANRSQWKPGKPSVFRAALDKTGFEENWGAATLLLLDAMDAWAAGKEDFQSARVFLSNVFESPGGEKVALLRLPMEGGPREMWKRVAQRAPGSLPASWALMMEDLQRGVWQDARRLSLWMLVTVVIVCWWARRSWTLVALSGLALAITFVGLLALLWITRESMTLHSLLAVPLVVAVAVEYSLYMLLALDANAGDVPRTFRQIAVPVLLMGLTTIIGFGAPVTASQPTLKNFGMVMALGTLAAMITGLVVVPVFDSATRRRTHRFLYTVFWFDVGEWIGRVFGRPGLSVVSLFFEILYNIRFRDRRADVRANLSLLTTEPVDDRHVKQTVKNFAAAMADYFLLGTRPKQMVRALVKERVGYEHLKRTQEGGRGAVLVTVHLGLFELGGVVMEEIGLPTVILSLPEPSPGLSEWRARYRKRWGVETLEVGADTFSFVEIIQELKQGKCVAMLIDRPHDANRILVDFPNGQVPFSTGPVWLSLLSGCPIIPATVVALPSGGYRLEAHAPVETRWRDGGREETVQYYTTQLGIVFRKSICEYPTQWYQFVPLSS